MAITTPTYEEEFERVLQQQAQGRQVHKIGVSGKIIKIKTKTLPNPNYCLNRTFN